MDDNMSEFDDFYKVYPKKIAKADARKAWEQTRAVRPDTQTLIEAVVKQCQTEQWMKNGGAFIPYPATWLRGERWDDEIEVKLPGVVSGKHWSETAQGIEAKGHELGLNPDDYAFFPEFKAAVMREAMVK